MAGTVSFVYLYLHTYTQFGSHVGLCSDNRNQLERDGEVVVTGLE